MYFPKLTRSPEVAYHSNRNGFYANYRDNYVVVAKDCDHRCVYCDITVEEYGGDELQLDHFRPQEHFIDLSNHPYNLYLACPKCNILKTSDWPTTRVAGAPSFIGRIGYIDRFLHSAEDYLEVDQNGLIVSRGGPIEYMIKKMHLNRPSRANVRKKRMIAHKKTQLLEKILLLMKKLDNAEAAGEIGAAQLRQKRQQVTALFEATVKGAL